MKNKESKKIETDWWDELSPAEQAELQAAIDESYDECNLVSEEEAEAILDSIMVKH